MPSQPSFRFEKVTHVADSAIDNGLRAREQQGYDGGVLHYGDRGPRDRDTDRRQHLYLIHDLGACDRIVQRKRQSPSPLQHVFVLRLTRRG
jgi:hypothetical protein